MDWLEQDANWKRVSEKMKAQWSAITDNDLQFLDRHKDALVAKVFERTGIERDAAERQVDALLSTLVTPDEMEPQPDPKIAFPEPGI